MTQHLVKVPFFNYSQLAQNLTAILFDTKNSILIWAPEQTKSTATSMHKFNLHVHYTKWEVQTLISQYTQGLKKKSPSWSPSILCRTQRTGQAIQLCDISGHHLPHIKWYPDCMCTTISFDPITMEILATPEYLNPTNKSKMKNEELFIAWPQPLPWQIFHYDYHCYHACWIPIWLQIP